MQPMTAVTTAITIIPGFPISSRLLSKAKINGIINPVDASFSASQPVSHTPAPDIPEAANTDSATGGVIVEIAPKYSKNKCAAILLTPRFSNTGATNTANTIYAADVGSPIPSRRLAAMESNSANNKFPPDIISIRLLILSPKPVRLMEPMIIPANIHAAATGAILFTEFSQAPNIFPTVIFLRFLIKPTINVTIIL